MFWDSWESMLRIAVTVPLIFLGVVVFVRITGVRAASKMNAFDWIVTVAMGSIVGSTIVLKNVTVIDGLAGIAALLCMQFLISFVALRLPAARCYIHNQPTMVVWNGGYHREGMKQARLTPIEIDAAVRKSGLTSVESAAAVIVEPDSSLSVIPNTNVQRGSTILGRQVGGPRETRRSAQQP